MNLTRTLILYSNRLVVCTGITRVVATDPLTRKLVLVPGRERLLHLIEEGGFSPVSSEKNGAKEGALRLQIDMPPSMRRPKNSYEVDL